jgi:hypothetical protein
VDDRFIKSLKDSLNDCIMATATLDAITKPPPEAPPALVGRHEYHNRKALQAERAARDQLAGLIHQGLGSGSHVLVVSGYVVALVHDIDGLLIAPRDKLIEIR